MILRSILALFSSVVFTPYLSAAILTVGPNGVYNSLQDALDAAVVAGGHQEIRVQAGTYHENLVVLSSDFAGTLLILGGWNDDFSSSSADAESTIIDGNQTGRPFTLEINGGVILIESITFSNGLVGDTLPFGGGVDARLTGNAVFRMENCSISAPPGNLGPLDCDRGPRIIDSTVDIGAFEGIPEIFTDGFESSTTQAWSSVSPGHDESPSVGFPRLRFDSDANRILWRNRRPPSSNRRVPNAMVASR